MDFDNEDNPYNLNKLTDLEEYLKNKTLDVELYENNSREAGSKKYWSIYTYTCYMMEQPVVCFFIGIRSITRD